MSSLVKLFLAFVSLAEAVTLFPTDLPYINTARTKRLFDLYFWKFGPKKIIGIALETSAWLSLCVTTYGILAPYFTYGSPLLMEYFFSAKKNTKFCKISPVQSFINSFHFLENSFSCKIMQKKPSFTTVYSFAG